MLGGIQRVIRRPCAAEGKSAARNVGLGVIVVAQLILPAPLNGVASADHGHCGREVVLRVVIFDEAVPLSSAHVVVEGKRRGRGSPHVVGNIVVVGGPAQRRQVEACQNRSASIHEAAARDVKIENCVRGEGVIDVDCQGFGVIELRAAIFA